MVRLLHNQFLRGCQRDVQLARDDDRLSRVVGCRGRHNDSVRLYQGYREFQQHDQLLQAHQRLVFLPCLMGNVQQLARSL